MVTFLFVCRLNRKSHYIMPAQKVADPVRQHSPAFSSFSINTAFNLDFNYVGVYIPAAIHNRYNTIDL